MADFTTATTVADALRSLDTRDTALDALEALPPPIADDTALAAAPALVDVWRVPPRSPSGRRSTGLRFCWGGWSTRRRRIPLQCLGRRLLASDWQRTTVPGWWPRRRSER